MMLISSLTSWRLGHIGLNEREMRLRNALDTIDRLERYRGHILNWYETRTLAALEPRSGLTVDGCNLAVSLITVTQALRDAHNAPPVGLDLWHGLEDTIGLLTGALDALDSEAARGTRTTLATMRETAERACDNEPEWIWAIEDLITVDMQRLREQVGLLAESAAENNIAALRDVQTWLERLEHHLLGMRRDLRIFAPWTERLASPPSGCAEIAARVAALMTYRSEEHTSELQSLMRISYAVFCLKKTIHLIQYI